MQHRYEPRDHTLNGRRLTASEGVYSSPGRHRHRRDRDGYLLRDVSRVKASSQLFAERKTLYPRVEMGAHLKWTSNQGKKVCIQPVCVFR